MQTSCPNCSNRLAIDDAKVPATPFMLKCPKCQGTIKLPGRGDAQPAPPATAPSQGTQSTPPSASAPQQRPPAAASSPGSAAPAPPGSAGSALVSFPAPDQNNQMAAVLTRLGFAVESLEPAQEKMLRLQQGDYHFVVTSRNGVSEELNVYRAVLTLPPEIRRRLFLMVVGDEFKTGEGTQAFAVLADLVLHPQDATSCDRLVAHTVGERRRLYKTYWDAEDRKLEGLL